MRKFTTEHTVYNFDELSDEAKQKALEDLSDINVEYDWYTYELDFNEGIFAKHGLEVDDINFELDYRGWADFREINIADPKLLLKSIGVDLRSKAAREALENGIGTAKHHYSGAEFRSYFETGNDDFDDRLSDLWQELTGEALQRLQGDYGYLTSKEAIIETIEANEYEFYEDGRLA